MKLTHIKSRMKAFFRNCRDFIKRNLFEISFGILSICVFIYGGIVTLDYALGGFVYLVCFLSVCFLLWIILMLILLIVYVVVSAGYKISSTIRKIQISYYTKSIQKRSNK